MSRPSRESIIARYDFALDKFQIDAIDALDAGSSVLVAAPTGSGKTLIAEYAIDAAIKQKQRAFYTAPIKAPIESKIQRFSCALWKIRSWLANRRQQHQHLRTNIGDDNRSIAQHDLRTFRCTESSWCRRA